jgi:hypothetical protein
VELAVAEAEPVVLDAAALELAVPPSAPHPTPPRPPVEFAVAVAEPVVLDADAFELAAPPSPPRGPMLWPTPLPPLPPKEAASADAAPVLIEVVAVEWAAPPAPPGPTKQPESALPVQDEPPLPPVAVAVFDGSLGVVVAAVAEPPAVPPFKPGRPFAPVTVTVPACTGIAPAARKTKGSALASSNDQREGE